MSQPNSFANINRSSSNFARSALGQSGLENRFDSTQRDSLAFLQEMLDSGQLDPKALQSLVPEAEATFDPFLAAKMAQPATLQAGQASRIQAGEARRRGTQQTGGFGTGREGEIARVQEAEALNALLGATAGVTAGASQQAAELGTQTSIANREGDISLTQFGLGTQAALRSDMSQRVTEIGLAKASALKDIWQTIYGAQTDERLLRISKEKDFFDKFAAIVGNLPSAGVSFGA